MTAAIAATVAFLGPYQQAPAATPRSPVAPPSTARVEPQAIERFRLYKTQNIVTLLLLDTRSGRIWQLQYGLGEKSDRGTVPLSKDVLGNGPEGRFDLQATDTMWNFILLDTIDGRTWQCQFSLDPSKRGCIPIDGPHVSD
jgi:hypothetical protein